MYDSESRSMRDNILVKNMEEEENETDEGLERKVMSFFESTLKISSTEAGKIKIERIHRNGKKENDSTEARNITVKMNSKGKSIVMRHLKNLDRSCSVRVVEQFPPKVHENRNKLWPEFISAKQQGKAARWNRDTLTIEGKVIKPPSDRNRNINIDTTEAAMELDVRRTEVVSTDNSQYQGHIVEISSIDDVVPAIKALCADTTVAGASHMMYAYRVGSERYSLQNWEDDGEWGSARWIMDAIQRNDVYGQLVCVTRWCSGKHVGRARRDTIRNIAEQALQRIT